MENLNYKEKLHNIVSRWGYIFHNRVLSEEQAKAFSLELNLDGLDLQDFVSQLEERQDEFWKSK